MILKPSISNFIYVTICLVIVMTAACGPATPQELPTIDEPATPTPEIFNPLNPSPTPSNSMLPMTCQVTDLNVYMNKEWGYCFAYPTNFTRDESRATEGMISFYGPALEDNPDSVRVSLELTTQSVPQGSSLARLADAYLTSFHELAGTIARESVRLGSEPAKKLEPVPGLLSSRVVIALHNNVLFTLRFHPSDIEFAESDLEALTQTVTGSFAFLSEVRPPDSHPRTISWYEFGQNISLSYDPSLAPWVQAQTVDAVPLSDQILFAEAHPTYAQIRFLGFQGGRPYDLPLLPLDDRVAQIRIFQIADFPGFGDDSPQGFVSQLQVLSKLIETGIDANRCAQPLTGYERALPFLPWINMQQSFCAQPQIIEFSEGKGIRYLSYYSQGPNPVLDQQVFYTFQGLTNAGKFYVSALFPIQTGIFPTNPPDCSKCSQSNSDLVAEWNTVLTEQLNQLNRQASNDFVPSLTVLDDIIKSIQIVQS